VTCLHCLGPVEQTGRGRPRLYCSQRCKNKGPRRSQPKRRAGDTVQTTLLYAVTNPATCHPDRKVVAGGLCSPCYHRVRRSGLDPDRAKADPLVEFGPCDICGQETRRVLDHDHRNGMARGQLCPSCNFGLGSFFDEPDRLRSALEYLTTWELHHLRKQRSAA
jgi:hypothetical protein